MSNGREDQHRPTCGCAMNDRGAREAGLRRTWMVIVRSDVRNDMVSGNILGL